MLASLAGCGMLNSVIESDKVDYKAAKKATPLEVPPDLTQLERDNRYAVPDGKGVATASGFQQQKASPTAATPTGATVGPVNTDQVRIERAGSQRWLVVKQTPEQLWPQLKEFWHDNGFTIETESAVTGVMETNWAENRAKIPQDFIRNTVGKVFDSLYSTGTRDRFRTRLERNADGSTDIFISHRGAEEVLTGPQKEVPTWTVRPNDPGLEAQFLARFMARVSGTPEVKTAVAAVNGAPAATPHAKLVGAGAAATVELDEGFDRAWRRVGLALDRVGFTVEDRDRVQGVYFVRYVDPDAKAPSFLSKLLSLGSNSDKEKEAQRYKVLVKSAAESSTTQVTVQSNDGKTDPGATGARILSVLNDELK
ncbi:MAG: outer membrane protein assembly factor BamC [Massilia sp.]